MRLFWALDFSFCRNRTQKKKQNPWHFDLFWFQSDWLPFIKWNSRILIHENLRNLFWVFSSFVIVLVDAEFSV